MKIIVISMWHNEAFLAPFFLNHYAYADKIHLLIGEDTTDNTLEICSKYPNVEIEEFNFPGGLINDELKIKKFNETIREFDCDWIIALDADELIFPPKQKDPREFLAKQESNLLYAPMWQVYRHVTESDLDPNKPAIWQRRYGSPLVHHSKPIVVKPEAEIEWGSGHHSYKKTDKIKESDDFFLGVHWAMADMDMAIARYIAGRKNRLSKENIARGHGYHVFELTEEKIREKCGRHENDPQLF